MDLMPRRLSEAIKEANNPPENDRYSYDGEEEGFTSSKYEKRHSDILDRRRLEKVLGLTQPSSNASTISSSSTPESSKHSIFPAGKESSERMAQNRNWRQWRPRSPWACSFPVLVTAILAIILILSIVHAFLTLQLDPKGCDMCWSRPVYIKFADFDTEHTRFASKYSLYMIREGGIDEDPNVRSPRNLYGPNSPTRRLEEFLFSSFPVMPGVSSRLDVWNSNPFIIFKMWSSKIPRRSKRGQPVWTSSLLISMRTSLLSTGKLCLIKPSM